MSNRRDHTAGLLQLHDLLATDSECSIYLEIHVDIDIVQSYNINFIMIINTVYKCMHAWV